jgi:ribosome silencing factor RsfS/YbeB/iojap
MQKKIEKFIEDLIKVCDKKKASDIRLYNVIGKSDLTDYILLQTVNNSIHCKALLEEIRLQSKKKDYIYTWQVSGNCESEWIIIDLGFVIIHLISNHLRNHYKLDELFEPKAVIYHH